MKKLATHTNVYGMSRVGTFKSKGTTYEIYVNTDDSGMIPHFHLRDKANWDNFHTCIQITSPEYFLHEGKSDVLNNSQKKLLQQFMESRVTLARYANKFENNWELICFLWDINNSDVQIPEDAVIPDYTVL